MRKKLWKPVLKCWYVWNIYLKAQIFLVGGYYRYTKYLKSYLNSSIYKPAQELHNKTAPKYDFNKQ